jgi:Flp pilus assembly protein TadG
LERTGEKLRAILKDRKGQNLVEFALVVPLLLMLVIGIAEFGRAWMTKNILTGAAREAVRMYAVKDDIGAADARLDNILFSASLDLSRRTIGRSNVDNTVSYTISYNFPTAIIGFLPGLDNISLSTTTTMRKEY